MKIITNHYINLIFIVIFSVTSTIFMINIMQPIKEFFIPGYKNCYDLFQNISDLDDKLFLISIFYTIYFIVYFVIFSIILIQYLKKKKFENIFSTTIILFLFNASVMVTAIYVTLEFNKSSKYWCDIIKDSCITSYKIKNHISNESNINISLKDMQPCFDNPIEYVEKAEKN